MQEAGVSSALLRRVYLLARSRAGERIFSGAGLPAIAALTRWKG